MSNYGDDMMDFGDDDDGEFLTGKLAALGIDEDLELSGGEEENEDSSADRRHVPPPKPAEALAEKLISNEDASAQTASATQTATEHVSQRAQENGGIEDGEVLEMLGKPLQTSRAPPWEGESSKSKRKAGKRGKGRGNNTGTRRKHGRNLTVGECSRRVCKRLNEPKYYLMCQVVATIGYNKSEMLLDQVQQIQDSGGMPTADETRKRTPGGVFFTLLKKFMEPAQLKALYADEIRVKKEGERARRNAKKRKAAAEREGEVGDNDMPPRREHRVDRDMGKWAGSYDDDAAVPKRARVPRSPGGGSVHTPPATVEAEAEARG